MTEDEPSRLSRTSEVAQMLGVTRSTICRWARLGKLSFVSTPGGHRRYRAEDVAFLIEHERLFLQAAAKRLREYGEGGTEVGY